MNKKILIAEDDKFLANAYRLKFENSSFEVKIASNGEETLEMIKSFQPDLVLLDLIMPILDGFGVLKVIKKDEIFKNIPVIVTSNLSQNEDRLKAKELGADDYLVKSDTTIGEIVQKITDLTNK